MEYSHLGAESVLGVLLGIELTSEGAALAYLTWGVRSSRADPLPGLQGAGSNARGTP